MNYRKKTEHEKIIGSTTKITYPNIVRVESQNGTDKFEIDYDRLDRYINQVRERKFMKDNNLEIGQGEFEETLNKLLEGKINFEKALVMGNRPLLDIGQEAKTIKLIKKGIRTKQGIEEYLKSFGEYPFKASIVMDLHDSDDIKREKVIGKTYHCLIRGAEKMVQKEIGYYRFRKVEPLFDNHLKILVLDEDGEERLVGKIIGFRFRTSNEFLKGADWNRLPWSYININERNHHPRKLIYYKSLIHGKQIK